MDVGVGVYVEVGVSTGLGVFVGIEVGVTWAEQSARKLEARMRDWFIEEARSAAFRGSTA